MVRPYTRVPINYDGWISTPDQVRYEKLCFAFTKLFDLVAHNEEQCKDISEWIESRTVMATSKSNQVGSQYFEAGNIAVGDILDPKSSRTKGAPKKLRRKGHFEATLRKTKHKV